MNYPANRFIDVRICLCYSEIMKCKQVNKNHIKVIYILLITLLFVHGVGFAEGEEWPLSAIGMTDNFDGTGVRIAVIDTGISTKHLDAGQVHEGKNYVFPEDDTQDLVGHGTHIAGIILGSESMSLQGVAPKVILIPLVYYSQYVTGVPKNGGVVSICQAIYDAVNVYDCSVIILSSGIPYDDDVLKEAVAYAEAHHCLVVSAVGNDNINEPENIYYPAAYDSVIGVGAAGEDGLATPISQRNSSVNLLAPGVNIPAVTNSNSKKAKLVNGSSFAAAYVAGAAALLLECNPGLTPTQIRELLYQSALDTGEPGYDIQSGFGILNIKNALQLAKQRVDFKDVKRNDRIYGPVRYVYMNGLMKGTGFDTFNPNAMMTSGMLALVKKGLGMQTYDVIKNNDALITREQLAVVLYEYVNHKNSGIYTDSATAMFWACEVGLLEYDGYSNLRPKENVIRAQMAVILHRLLVYVQ